MFERLSATSLSGPKLIATLVAVAALSGTATAAVTITTLNYNPLDPGQGQLQDSAFNINGSNMTYSGLDVTGTNVTVYNSGSSSHSADVHVILKDTSGSVLESKTKTISSLGAGNTTKLTISYSSSYQVDTVGEVEVRIEQTA